MLTYARKLWRWGERVIPSEGFFLERPAVLFQSDDWGRIGLRDGDGVEALRAEGLSPERPYDFYSLEHADDLAALNTILRKHRDSTGAPPRLGMNFLVFNLDLGRMRADEYRSIHLLPLAEGAPQGHSRPGLMDAYLAGVKAGVFAPALHGITHFCPSAVEQVLKAEDERAGLLKSVWKAGAPYIYWRMPWIGYEYWDPGRAEEKRFLSLEQQQNLIGTAVGGFAKLFSTLPHSACAPGYRANDDTHRCWAQHGVHVVQNGPGRSLPVHFDRYGLLHLCRTVEFEPATDPEFSLEKCVQQAEASFGRGLPAIVSVHSINFQSKVRDFRSRTLQLLDQFLLTLEAKHADILYLRDEDMFEIVRRGFYSSQGSAVPVKVTKKRFTKMSWSPVVA
ncbi:MAG TPA: hypothetical protein VKV39_01590 [Candidatus Sulfotelmatobacter sp.]|nr:hypothetical protein [Candidatus Sulfotelmatobacter sp.]